MADNSQDTTVGQDLGVNWEIMPPREVLGNASNAFDLDKQGPHSLGATGVGPSLTPAEETDGIAGTTNPGI